MLRERINADVIKAIFPPASVFDEPDISAGLSEQLGVSVGEIRLADIFWALHVGCAAEIIKWDSERGYVVSY